MDALNQVRHKEMLKLLQTIFVGYWVANLCGATVLWLAGISGWFSPVIIAAFLLINFSITEAIKRLKPGPSLQLEKFRYWVIAPILSALMVVFIAEPLAPFWFGFLTLALGTGPMLLRMKPQKIPHGISYGIYLGVLYTIARLYAGDLNTLSDWIHHFVQTLSVLLVCISYSLTVSRLGAILSSVAEKERYLNELQEIAELGDYRFEVRENNLHLSKGGSRILGRGDDALEGQLDLLLESIHPDDRPKFDESFKQTIRLGADAELHFRIVEPSGRVRYARCVRHAERSEETGAVTVIKGILQDMTQNHLMYEKQRETDALLKAVVNELPVGIAYQEERGSFHLRNSAYERMESLLATSPDSGLIDKNLCRAREGSASRATLQFQAADGDEGVAEINFYPFKQPDGKVRGVILAAFDNTAERRAEELVERQRALVINASRMSALGEMASGIAHEINNPLAIISGKTQQLIRRIQSGALDAGHAESQLLTVDSMVKRIAAIVRGLRSFARDGQKDPFEKSSIKVMIDDTIALCQSRFENHAVKLEVVPLARDLTIDCRAVQITQVLLNLLNNAYDAVKELPEKWVRLAVEDSGDFVVFSVVDSGPGIPELIREKILKPFFTTKAVGEGTGLGLSIASGIAKEHRGQLIVDPKNLNTCFVLTLPKTQPTAD